MAAKKLKRGLLIGVLLGFVFSVWYGASNNTAYFPWWPLIITTITCGVIGFAIGLKQDEEAAEQQEREYIRQKKIREHLEAKRKEEQNRQAEEQRFRDWSDRIHLKFRKIEKAIGAGYSPDDAYDSIWDLRDSMRERSRYETEFERQHKEHCKFLRKELGNCLLREMGIGGLAAAVSAAECLVKAEPDVEDNVRAASALTEALSVAIQPLSFVSFNTYGDCDFVFDQPGAMEVAASKSKKLLEKFKEAEQAIREMNGDIVKHIIQYINAELIMDQCMLMWYYANLKPFDVTGFENARLAYLTHTALYCKDEGAKDDMKVFAFGGENMKVIALGKVEEVLARIYSKNQIGGAGTVRQEKDYIEFWLAQRIKSEDFEECYILASGLAWMELYELELDVLRKLVAEDVPLPTDMQERLGFLESGGTVNIKLYDVKSDSNFHFDSSSVDWKANEFSVFFRKMAMKKACVNYSMAISKWTKTLPLASGQKLSKEHLYQELSALVEDFDGEITAKKMKAVAINLANLEYPDAVLFEFMSERNRCVSLLFACEKYGRNLNVTILTLFTPDTTIPFDQLEKYCLAIKDNVYAESFRESVLQVVDDEIKVKQSVYGDDDLPKKRIVFDE